MKSLMKLAVVAAMATFAMRTDAAYTAYTEVVNGIEWTYVKNGGDACIFNPSYKSAIPDDTTGAITIPSVLGGCPVTHIQDGAFAGCRGLTGVTIPDSVTSIEKGAFTACNGIRSVTIPQCVCSGMLLSVFSSSYQTITNIVFSDGVTSIGELAFMGCAGLTRVVIPDGVKRIEDFAFMGCSGLTSVTIPDSVTSIGEKAFDGCSDALLDCMTVSGVKLVDNWAVGYTDDLSGDLNLPGVRGIGDYVFADCRSITNLTIPDSVTSVGEGAFYACSGLEGVTISSNVTSIGELAFAACGNIRSVTIPQYVCSRQLLSVFPTAYQTITNVVVSDGVTSIKNFAFEDCVSLARVSIPDSVTSIGEGAFDNCSDVLYDTNTVRRAKLVDGWAIGHAGDIKDHLDLTGVRGIGDCAFEECDYLGSVRIPGSVKSVGYGAFDSCYGITNVQIDAGVANIGEWAFGSCDGLTSVTIPASVTNIGDWAFCYCVGITNIIFKGNAPAASDSSFQDVAPGCTAYVSPSSTGWGVEEGQTWHGLTLKYLNTVEDELVYEIVDFAIEEATQGGVSVRRMIVGVVAKAGETPVRGDAENVATMFEATSDLGDWVGPAKLTPTVEVLEAGATSASLTMRFRVLLGDGTATSAFLRIRR